MIGQKPVGFCPNRCLFYEGEGFGFGDGLASVADAEFAIDVLEVGLDGVDGDTQAVGNLLIGAMLGEKSHDIHLAVAEGL